jgi:hypothetical protein
MDDIKQVALAIAKGGLFGSTDPNAVLTLCLLAQAEGQHPAVVFRDYHIIQGKPAKKADAMLRDFITSGGKVEWHALTDECADATFTHPSGSARIDWTLERAKAAGINNPMWRKYPRQMLRSRVISEGVRTVFPGATSGLYEVDELRDVASEAAAPAPADEPATKRGLDGPYTSKKALKDAVEAHQREMMRCGDEDTLTCLMATDDAKALFAQCERDAPHYLHGGEPAPPEWIGIYQREKEMLDQFRIEAATYEPAEEKETTDA